MTRTIELASDVSAAPFERTQAVSTWPSVPSRKIALNGEVEITVRDSFGRPTQTEIQAAGIDHVAAEVAYYDADREIIETAYPSTPDRPQITHTHLDALGRPRFRQVELGADYGSSTLVEGLVEYDGFGRVTYQAAPFEWPTLPFMPEDLPVDRSAWPYGITAVYDDRGRVVHTVEAKGQQPTATSTTVSADVYVANYYYSWEDRTAIVRTQGPGQTDPSSATWGTLDEARSSATGWLWSTSRWANGARIDAVQYGYDHLGDETTVTRYQSPGTLTGPVTWTRTYDSRGLPLTSQEAGGAVQQSVYDDWGELMETSWVDGSYRRLIRHRYDGFGRATSLDVARLPTSGGPELAEWSETYHYDAPSGSSLQPASVVRGRLSWIDTKSVGREYFAYDVLGRPASETYFFDVHGKKERVSRVFDPGGTLAELDFDTPAGVDRIRYVLDSALRTRKVIDNAGLTLFDAVDLDAKGRYRKVNLGNGVTEHFDFAPDGPEELTSWDAVGPTWKRVDQLLTRDGAGRLLSETMSVGSGKLNTTNSYDAMGRLAHQSAMGSGGVSTEDVWFKYDPLGNLTNKNVMTSSSQTRTYQYDGSDPDRLMCFHHPAHPWMGCGVAYDVSHQRRRDDTASGGREPRRFRGGIDETATEDHR